MIRLDTHVVVWLYAGDIARLGSAPRDTLKHDTVCISPMVELELTFLHEVGRLTVTGAHIVDDLRDRIGLRTSTESMSTVATAAATIPWTRDPFGRMIVADAVAANTRLVTKDESILANLALARW